MSQSVISVNFSTRLLFTDTHPPHVKSQNLLCHWQCHLHSGPLVSDRTQRHFSGIICMIIWWRSHSRKRKIYIFLFYIFLERKNGFMTWFFIEIFASGAWSCLPRSYLNKEIAFSCLFTILSFCFLLFSLERISNTRTEYLRHIQHTCVLSFIPPPVVKSYVPWHTRTYPFLVLFPPWETLCFSHASVCYLQDTKCFIYY